MHGRPAPQEVGEPRESHPQRWQILGVLLLALVVTSIDHTVIRISQPDHHQLPFDLLAISPLQHAKRRVGGVAPGTAGIGEKPGGYVVS